MISLFFVLGNVGILSCLYSLVVIADCCPSQLAMYISGTERQQLSYTAYDLKTHLASVT